MRELLAIEEVIEQFPRTFVLLDRCRFDCDKFFAAETCARADLPDRLRDTPLPIWRVARFRPLRPGSRRIHQADYALASRTAAANMALSHGRVL